MHIRLNEYIDDLYELIYVMMDRLNPNYESISETCLHFAMFDKYGFESAFYFNDAIRCLESEGKLIRMSSDKMRMVWWEIPEQWRKGTNP